jgi:hypothetical protein
MQKRRAAKVQERRSLMSSLTDIFTKDKDNKDKNETYVENTPKNKEPELKIKENPTSKKSKDSEEYIELEDKNKDKKGKSGSDTFSKLKEIGKSKNDDTNAFEKLKSLKVDDVSSKIADLSGKSEEKIKPVIKSSSTLDDKDALRLFGGLEKDQLMSESFKDVMSKLMSSGKISKEHVSHVLFEYMDKGVLSKSEVAKISSELKLI